MIISWFLSHNKLRRKSYLHNKYLLFFNLLKCVISGLWDHHQQVFARMHTPYTPACTPMILAPQE